MEESPKRKKHKSKQKSVKVSKRFHNRNNISPNVSGNFKKNLSNVVQSNNRNDSNKKQEKNINSNLLNNKNHKISQSINRYGTLTSQKSNRDYLIDINEMKNKIKPTSPLHNSIERHDPKPQNYDESTDNQTEHTNSRFSKTSLNKINKTNESSNYANVFDSKPELLDPVNIDNINGKNQRYTVLDQRSFQPHFQEIPVSKYTTNQPIDNGRKRVNTLFPQGTFKHNTNHGNSI